MHLHGPWKRSIKNISTDYLYAVDIVSCMTKKTKEDETKKMCNERNICLAKENAFFALKLSAIKSKTININ